MKALTTFGGGKVFKSIRVSPRVSVRLWGCKKLDIEEAWYIYVDGERGTCGPFLREALDEAASVAGGLEDVVKPRGKGGIYGKGAKR